MAWVPRTVLSVTSPAIEVEGMASYREVPRIFRRPMKRSKRELHP